MSKLNTLIVGRLKSREKEKVKTLAMQSASGMLSGFAGMFRPSPITENEREFLKKLLDQYGIHRDTASGDLLLLTTLTAEVKAIMGQAVILHGERIKCARDLFKKYRTGAFSAWLVQTYGNRQTPYNFLRYYELYLALPHTKRAMIEEMPKQVAYALAGRNASLERKQAFIEEYRGESKARVLEALRRRFALPQEDRRNANRVKSVWLLLDKVLHMVQDDLFTPTKQESEEMQRILKELEKAL